MAEQTPLYMDINNVYSGDELGLPYRDIMGEGVVGANDLAVSAGAGNSINVAAGAGWVQGDTDANRQPTYRIYNDATVNKGITPDPTNPRYVRVFAQITDATFAGVLRNWVITTLHGTPAGSPAIPALPASALDLATILVPAAAASSAAYTFTEGRVRAAVGAGLAVAVRYGTAFPASPTDGQEFVLVGSATTGAFWRFRYNAASASAYKWECVGGGPMYARIATFETRSVASYADIATVGPQITVPRLGDYLVRYGSLQLGQGQTTLYDPTTTSRYTATEANAYSTAAYTAVSTEEEVLNIPAGTVLTMKYYSGTGSTSFGQRWMSLSPLRVS